MTCCAMSTCDSVNETFDKDKHQFHLSFRVRNKLCQLIDEIVVVAIQGIAEVQGYIKQILDVATKLIGEILTPGHDIHISGSKIKLAGAGIGIFFINVLGDRFKAVEINIYTPGLLNVSVPDNLAVGLYIIEIVTKYTAGTAKLLKEARVISYIVQLRVK
ncbi:hypothetical protein Barb6XT_02019 [Bacteroidales bacterium Barb6XT]|nr:hypothetical protein Barb6XT_02019 [Bacteroidales bacterium Barb6XT]